MTATTDTDVGLRLLEDMVRVRRMEEKCAELYGAMKIRGFLHLYIGEEACAAGVLPVLSPDDNIVATYREHGHALLRGIPMRSIMAEMYGRESGCAHGRGGSMHLFDASRRFYGGTAIVASGLPLAVGLALADVMQGRDGITVCFFGDGASAEGAFHESLNLAALWRLPVLFVCENNLYAMGTALHRAQSQTDLCAKAAAYKLPTYSADGMDVRAVRAAAVEAVEGVRADRGPRFLELRTYRFRAHSMFDPDLYRDKSEVEAWKLRDPIPALAAQLREAGHLDESAYNALEAAAAAEVDDAVAYAEAAGVEPVASLLDHVTAAVGAGADDESEVAR
ncbi:MAG TPA: pyruvate dehydrogenase (acetyl-transferring) E1 component subunit alpha [Propionibacteriaceae bacterium]|nr:pyruvate dehydrogenase (acetyl-transferring) E1 component subunit alpha [Propionibacteriaceae bacterium]